MAATLRYDRGPWPSRAARQMLVSRIVKTKANIHTTRSALMVRPKARYAANALRTATHRSTKRPPGQCGACGASVFWSRRTA